MHPLAIAVGLEAMFPYIHEVITIDIALMVVATDAGTGGNGAIDEDGTNSDASLTGVEMVAYFTFIVSKEPFATVSDGQTPQAFCHLPKTPSNSPSMGRTWRGAGGFLTDGTNEIEDKAELFVGELQLGISSCTPYREDREDAPTGHTLADEILMDVGKFEDIRRESMVRA